MNRRQFLRYSGLAGVVGLVASYPIFIERNWVVINKYQIPIKGLPRNFSAFTIAQLTDIHFGFLVTERFIKKVVQMTNELHADVIVCTGDYVHKRNEVEEIEKVWPLISKLKAKHGVHSILGNHDHWADADRSLYHLKRSGQNLRHQTKSIEIGDQRIWLGGAGDLWEDELGIDKTFGNIPDSETKILLSHNPDSLDTDFKSKIDLCIAGHTHGGQVSIPFVGPPIVPVQNKIYTSGLIKTKKTSVFISRGIGWAILPIRVNCYPEISVLELTVA